MDDNNDNFGLSRRQMLGGLGMIGVASAGAGLGTTAYFSDEESFEENTLTAGTLALNVTQTIQNIDQDGIGPDELEVTDNGDFPATVSPIEITDAKPGDSYEFCWEVELEGNPGFAMVQVKDLSEQNGVEAGYVTVDDLWDIDDEEDMTTIGDAATASATLTLCPEDGEEVGEEVSVYPTEGDDSLAGLLGVLSDGIPVPSDLGEESDGEGNDVPEVEYCHDTECPVTLCVEIDIDEDDVGNELQGAESSFDLHVYAEQCRHNDLGTFMSNATGDGDDDDDDDDDDTGGD